MFPRAFLLSLIWYVLVLILVAIEMAIKSLLSRSDDGGEKAEGIVGSIFGSAADALRMMGFMMIPIMMFEDVGLSEGFKRLKLTLKNSPIAALSGLALTKMATSLIFLVVWGIFQVVESVNVGGLLIGIALFAVLGMGWMLAMYLEQLFATGLYLYTTFPESPVVGILLQEHIGRELPTVPAPGAAGT